MTFASIILSTCYQCRGSAASLIRRIDSQTLNLCEAIPFMILDKNEAYCELLQIGHEDSRIAALGKVYSCLLESDDVVFIPADAIQDASDMDMVAWLKRPDLELYSFIFQELVSNWQVQVENSEILHL